MAVVVVTAVVVVAVVAVAAVVDRAFLTAFAGVGVLDIGVSASAEMDPRGPREGRAVPERPSLPSIQVRPDDPMKKSFHKLLHGPARAGRPLL